MNAKMIGEFAVPLKRCGKVCDAMLPTNNGGADANGGGHHHTGVVYCTAAPARDETRSIWRWLVQGKGCWPAMAGDQIRSSGTSNQRKRGGCAVYRPATLPNLRTVRAWAVSHAASPHAVAGTLPPVSPSIFRATLRDGLRFPRRNSVTYERPTPRSSAICASLSSRFSMY